jgi:hypothetical protein
LELTSLDLISECSKQKTYQKFYGSLCELLCGENKYVKCFEQLFQEQYKTCHRLSNIELRIIPILFANLFITDSISWTVCINS